MKNTNLPNWAKTKPAVISGGQPQILCPVPLVAMSNEESEDTESLFHDFKDRIIFDDSENDNYFDAQR